MKKLAPISFNAGHFNVVDNEKFSQAMSLLKESLACKGGTLFSADNTITWNKNYSFLRDERYLEYVKDESTALVQKSIVWRTYVLDFFMSRALSVDGDVLELGVLDGSTVKFLYGQHENRLGGRAYYLIDLFGWSEGDTHTKHSSLLDENLFERVSNRFNDYQEVRVLKGNVIDVLPTLDIAKVAFAHIDMNAPEPELFALEHLAPLMMKGGCIIFDDYGWWGYCEQKVAIDNYLHDRNLQILELPTGQGVLLF